MAYATYISYKEYKNLGGVLSEESFIPLERKARRWLDYFTFNRISELPFISDEIRDVMVEFIDRLNTYGSQRENGDLVNKYSNGVETFEYSLKSDDEIKTDLQHIVVDWLPTYLTSRVVNFNVTEYIQRNSNHT